MDFFFCVYSNLSLTGEDPDSPDSLPPCAPGSFSDRSRTQVWENRPSLTKKEHLQELRCKGTQSSPASLSGSQSDIPLLLINGAPEPDPVSPGPKTAVDVPASSPKKPRCLSLSGSQPSMKFVMDTSKFWFRPHISRAEGEETWSYNHFPVNVSVSSLMPDLSSSWSLFERQGGGSVCDQRQHLLQGKLRFGHEGQPISYLSR